MRRKTAKEIVMTYALIALGVALVVLISIIFIRAMCFLPPVVKADDVEIPEMQEETLAEHFSEFIKCKTLTLDMTQELDAPEHEKFIALIQELYPKTFAKCEFKRVNTFGLVLKFKGKSDKTPSCIMSHYDVVPVTAENWEEDPFGGVIKDGKVIGRGALDNKATFLCSMEAMEKTLEVDPDFTPEDDIYFTFGGDEETAGLCQQAIVKEFEEEGKKFKLVLDEGGAIVKNIFPGVAEDIAVIGLAEKGIANIELSVDSNGGHASTPAKSDPANVLARALVALEKNPMKAEISTPVSVMLDTLGRYSSFGLKLVFANMWLFKGLVKKIFEKGLETNAMLRTTFAYTELSGSNAKNVLPTTAKCNVNIRMISGDTIDTVVEHIKKVVNDDRVKIKVLTYFNPGPAADVTDFGYQTVQATMHEVYPEVVVTPYIMLAASDSRFYGNVSDNTLKFAPLRMSAKQRKSVHGDNECIETCALKKGTEFYYALLKKL